MKNTISKFILNFLVVNLLASNFFSVKFDYNVNTIKIGCIDLTWLLLAQKSEHEKEK